MFLTENELFGTELWLTGQSVLQWTQSPCVFVYESLTFFLSLACGEENKTIKREDKLVLEKMWGGKKEHPLCLHFFNQSFYVAKTRVMI